MSNIIYRLLGNKMGRILNMKRGAIRKESTPIQGQHIISEATTARRSSTTHKGVAMT